MKMKKVLLVVLVIILIGAVVHYHNGDLRETEIIGSSILTDGKTVLISRLKSRG